MGFGAAGGVVLRPARSFPIASEFRTRVIVEELLHLKVPNHGKLFKALLRSYLADGRVSENRHR